MHLFVGNVPYSFQQDALIALFQQAGQVVSGKIITDRYSGRSRGFGFIEFALEEEGKKAIALLHNMQIEGVQLVVHEALVSP